jgi:hypothetical protein
MMVLMFDVRCSMFDVVIVVVVDETKYVSMFLVPTYVVLIVIEDEIEYLSYGGLPAFRNVTASSNLNL